MSNSYTCLRCVSRQLRSSSRSALWEKTIHRTSSQRFFRTQTLRSVSAQRSRIHTKRPEQAPTSFAARTPEAEPPHVLPSQERRAPILQRDDLLHSYSESPLPEIRKRAAFIKHHAYCPHPSHHQTRLVTSPEDFEARKAPGTTTQPPAHVRFECPDCKVPVYCCEEHWADDYEMHLEVCDTLRQINEDDHDLRSGRFFREFQYPGPQKVQEALINMSNWDVFLYTREFEAINDPQRMRQATALLTYPITIGSILHELSPYSLAKDGRLTTEGLKSLSALRYSLHPPRTGAGIDVKGIRLKPPPARIFILGARAESSLPREVWIQLSHMFSQAQFHLIFIGPESMANRDAEFPLPERTPSNPFGELIEAEFAHDMKISTYVDYFHNIHKTGYFGPYDPYFDVFVLFHPGLGHPASSHEWEETLPMLLETKCPIISTGYTEWDLKRDMDWVDKTTNKEYDLLLKPSENIFRSLRWDLNERDPSDVTCANWGVWMFRGKRYQIHETVTEKPDES